MSPRQPVRTHIGILVCFGGRPLFNKFGCEAFSVYVISFDLESYFTLDQKVPSGKEGSFRRTNAHTHTHLRTHTYMTDCQTGTKTSSTKSFSASEGNL